MEISVTDFLPLYTSKIVAKYSDHQRPKSFGRSFFIESAVTAKLVAVISQRGLNKIATDVARGSRGNLNVYDRSTQQITMPPYYNEFFALNELDSYDAVQVEGVDGPNWGRFLEEVEQKIQWCMDAIDRRYELMCFQNWLLGYVTLNNGDNISMGRQAGSFVTLTGGDKWDSADPWVRLRIAYAWIVEQAKMSGDVVDVIMGKNVLQAYLDNAAVKARALQVQWGRENMAPAMRNQMGALYQGMTQFGEGWARFWTYQDFYETDNGGSITKTPYMDANSFIMLPGDKVGTLTYAGVPKKLKGGEKPVAQKFHLWQGEDNFGDNEYIGVKSAGLAQLIAKDACYTAKVL